jgi:predicted MPP superfamily phosphohydrolase
MLRMAIFGVVTTSIWSLVHVYLGRHLIGALNLTGRAKVVGWGLVASHGVLAPIALIGRRGSMGGWFWDGINMATYVGMGFVALLFLVFLTLDLARLVSRIADKIAGKQPDPDRRQFLTGSVNLGAFALTGVATGVGFQKATKIPDIKEVVIEVPGLHANLDGFVIAQISDMHIGPTLKRDFLNGVIDRAMTIKADLIAITGDSVDAYVKDLGRDIKELTRLEAKHGVFIVTGNHEYYFDGVAWADFYKEIGLKTMNNAHELIRVDRARLLVGGVTDFRAGQLVPEHTSDPHLAMQDAPEHDFSILLAHQPSSVYEAALAGWRLQLSGHTHGGQFFPFNFVIGLIHEFSVGLGKHVDTLIYVSRGAGYWGPPNRLGAPSEITKITLRRT